MDASGAGRWFLDLPLHAAHPHLAPCAASGQRQARRAEHRALAQHIEADLVTFSHSTHNPMVEEPDKFNALLRHTCAELEGE
jgi:pimeloyl-ACP methyl ester carboxylesterase